MGMSDKPKLLWYIAACFLLKKTTVCSPPVECDALRVQGQGLHFAGLGTAEASARLKKFGPNKVSEAKPPSLLTIACRSLFEPFNLLLLSVAVLTICPPNEDRATFVLIMVSMYIFQMHAGIHADCM